jgi:hypothetical protein
VIFEWWQILLQNMNRTTCIQLIYVSIYQQNATIHGPITCYSNDKPDKSIDGYLNSIFRPIWKNYGLPGIENPDLLLPPIYRRIFHVPKGGGKSGFYCIYKMQNLGLPLYIVCFHMFMYIMKMKDLKSF